MKYFVRIGADEHVVDVDGESVTCDGETLRAHVERIEGSRVYLVRIGSATHAAIAERGAERGEYELAIGGYRFAGQVLDERARAIRELSGAAARPATPAHLVAPMPGLIVRVNVNAGAHVTAGQSLVVMEAMKMENELRAHAAGVVKRVVAVPGSAVEKGTLLLEMEN